MRLAILAVLIIGSLGSPVYQNLNVNHDGTYQFSYQTGNEGGSHFRTESKGPDGTVIGKYSYKDPTGEMRVVNYRADDSGFLASEDGEIPQPSASEPELASDGAVKADSSEKDDKEKQKEETNSSPDEEEEEKPLKLEEPIDDGPPDGFPIGFFTGQFSALRRLPEPKKEEKPTKKKDEGKADEPPSDEAAKDPQELLSALLQPEAFPPGFFLHHFTGLRRLEEPVKEEGSVQTIDETKSTEHFPGSVVPSSYIFPFPSLTPQLWPAPAQHHPVYVYSNQQPNAYSYGYSY